MSDTFRKDLVYLDVSYPSQDEFYLQIGKDLQEKGYVKESFGPALIKREAEFPTGLRTESYDVAIPHTDVEHVEKAFIAFVRLADPIEYSHMGEPELKIQARFAFVLGIMEPHAQVETLQALMGLIIDADTMKKLEDEDDPEKIVEILNSYV